jgi:hypothetical protein
MRREEIRMLWRSQGKVVLFRGITVRSLALLVLMAACSAPSDGRLVKLPQATPSSEQSSGGSQGQTSNTDSLSPSEEIPTVASSPPATPEAIERIGASALTAQLELPTEVQVGKPVSLTFKLRNTRSHPVELILGGRPPYDFVITKEDGTEIWRWSQGQVIQFILEIKTLLPGEELEFATEWQQVTNAGAPVPPGTYWVWGIINLDPPEKLETEPTPLIITSQ